MASGVAHSEWARNQEIVTEFFIKSLQIILESRIPNFTIQEQGGGISSPSSLSTSVSGLKARQKWFNLVLDDCPSASEITEPWRADISQPLVIDVLLSQPKRMEGHFVSDISREKPSTQSSSMKHEPFQDALIGEEVAEAASSQKDSTAKIILERWIIWYDDEQNSDMPDRTAKRLGVRSSISGGLETTAVRLRKVQTAGAKAMKGGDIPANRPPVFALDLPTVYKKSVIFLRSLYCTVRALPAHLLFRLANSSSEACNFSLDFEVSRVALSLLQAEKLAMTEKSFGPVELQWGKIHMSVAYRHAAAVSALEVNHPVQPRIISDYVGSPTTDHLRRLTGHSQTGSLHTGGLSGRREIHVVSIPPGVPGCQRSHSWSEGKLQPEAQIPLSYLPSSCPFGDFLTNIQNPVEQNLAPTQRSPIYSHPLKRLQDDTQVWLQSHSPWNNSKFSPSCSPPVSFESKVHSFEGPSSAPVRMQRQMVPNRETSPRTTRGLLPPLSPRRKSTESSSQGTLKPGLQIGQMQDRHAPSFERNTLGGASSSNVAEFMLLNLPPHPFHIHQVPVDERIEEKLSFHGTSFDARRTLWTSSRSASKSSSEDNLEEEILCPFAPDISEKDEFRARNEPFGLPQPLHPSAFTSPESQAAAAGVLVRILKSAAPLRESVNVSGISTLSQRQKPSRLPVQKGLARVSAISGGLGSKGLPAAARNRLLTSETKTPQIEGKTRKTTHDALEELRGYRELKEFLERQSGQTHCESPNR